MLAYVTSYVTAAFLSKSSPQQVSTAIRPDEGWEALGGSKLLWLLE